jgi:phosphohistidine phosphatase
MSAEVARLKNACCTWGVSYSIGNGVKLAGTIMLILMLLRHAKSSWSEPGQADIDRHLNDRGRDAARAMGRHMVANGLEPQLVLCSPALRARETWGLVGPELKTSPILLIERNIYDFGGGEALMDCICRKSGVARSVLVVGHNPSIEELALKLIRNGKTKLLGLLEEKYPTGALAVIHLDIASWDEVTTATGTLVRFDRPKDLPDGGGRSAG